MRVVGILILAVCFFSLNSFSQTNPAPSEQKALDLDHFDAKTVDSSVDPCTDFYKYSCNKWIEKNPVPADEVFWGSFGKLALWNTAAVHQTILDTAAKAPNQRTPVEQKVGDYWAACTNQSRRDETALALLRPQLARIDAITNKNQIADILAFIHTSIPGAWEPADPETYAPIFGFGSSPDFHDTTHVIAQFDQGGMGLPGREFYLNDDAKSVEIRNKFVEYLSKLLVLAGTPQAQADADAAISLQMQTAMAKSAMEIVKRRDPKNLDNEMELAEVKKLAPAFDFDRYLELLHAPRTGKFIVTSPDFFRGLDQLIQTEPLDHWKIYLKTSLLSGEAGALSNDFVNARFDFYGRTLSGAKEIEPLWRRCVESEDHEIGEALGQAYAARYFPPESKERVQQMVKNIEAALGRDIDSVDWMSPQTKAQAHEKLAAVVDKMGYPDHWRDYSSLQITPDNHLANVQNATAFEMHRQLQKIGKPLDRTEWQMTPPTVNAYEDPQTNTINFPAGILQPPFFDPTQDDAVNYGAAGAVIGHETTHGFDDQGRKFDKEGNLRDWWTPADAQAYDKRADCIADAYTEEIPEIGAKQNGRLTLGENTADNGGVRLALSALKADLKDKGLDLDAKGADGVTNLQRFFLSYANVWCSNVRPEMMRTLVMSNPHPLDRFRVDNVVSNMPEFAHAFGCHKGQAMVRENMCRVW
ncbi:MAG TPA: M13 family metallopeptidase [Terriglobales bacterium]|nr:M13 family metallopeptidase [Terriglobales bacterium]